ncbi:MAG: DUF3276 family protein [Treponemataceae bacterium]
MGIRGELFTTQITLDNRSYFFNVKENRAGDVFLQVVESKNKSGEDFDRHAIVVFEEDMQKFFQGLDSSLKFIEKNAKAKQKARAEKKAEKDLKYGEGKKKQIIRKKIDEKNKVKKTGVVRVVSKRNNLGE